MKTKIITLLLVAFATITNAQNTLDVIVVSEENQETLIGATLLLKGTTNGVSTNIEGAALLNNIPNGKQTIVVSYIGYEDKEVIYDFPQDGGVAHEIKLSADNTEIDEIIVEATRGNRTVANLPTRTEVLTDEIDEAASMEPSKIGHLITHSTGIQVQTTAAGSNGAVVRIQGLNGRYTQMLKDGFPLYGGFSGSLDILQIPPLDLRQVEFVKGSASTLYGGGAIAGIVNLLTKKANKDETLLHINLSHIGAKDFNAFTSKRFGKWGFTNLASMHIHDPYDADENGFSDIAQVSKFNFNPKLFYNPNKKTELYFGAGMTKENRKGGSINSINNIWPNYTEFYLDYQESSRTTTQFSANYKLDNTKTISLKNSVSSFDRYIDIRETILGTSTTFGGNQLNSFTELNLNINKEKQNINIGLNALTDKFTEDNLINQPLRNQEFNTLGLYVNHLWDVTDKFALESGLRTDKVEASTLNTENGGQSFVLPKISALYKMTPELSIRLGGGMGYRMPSLFSEEAEPYGYKNVQAVNFENLVAEESYGTNIDFKYQSTFGTDNVLLSLNQMFFFNVIDNPITLNETNANNRVYEQTNDSLLSKGFESQIKLTVDKFTWFLGYTYTDAYLENGENKNGLTLTPKHSIKGDLLFVVDNKWRIGWDYDYKSGQFLNNGHITESLFTTGVIVERTIDNFVIFLNAENFTDVRQSNVGDVLTDGSPQFTEVWAPLDGYFFNMGLKIKL
ncbi:MAG: outer membrane receptor for ferrienterochelin and colicins [bacterium]|jgi:outer membrane receptor for ferrienterochelin and colicins